MIGDYRLIGTSRIHCWKDKFYRFEYHLYYLCAQIIENFCVLEATFTRIWIKFGEIMCQFYVYYLNIYNLYMCECETIRKRLISYSTFISVNSNLKTTYWLTGYSVKVHSTA